MLSEMSAGVRERGNSARLCAKCTGACLDPSSMQDLHLCAVVSFRGRLGILTASSDAARRRSRPVCPSASCHFRTKDESGSADRVSEFFVGEVRMGSGKCYSAETDCPR